MRFVDDPIRRAAGRTPRELLVIATGLLMLVTAIRTHDTTWQGPVIAAVTIAFAARVFAARVAALAMCVSALALIGALLVDARQRDLAHLPAALQFAAGVVVLMSRDLRARFDDGGRGLGPLRNFWRDLPVGDRRSIARLVCTGAATASLLYFARIAVAWNAPTGAAAYAAPVSLTVLVALAIVAGVLLLAGRAAGLVAAAAFAAATLVLFAPRLAEADRAMHGAEKTVAWWLDPAGGYVIAAVPAAALTLAFALPWLVRLARRALR